MGSGDWFKNIISLKKAKNRRSKQIKGSSAPEKSNGVKYEDNSEGKLRVLGMPVKDVAATRIQTAFRAYMARKNLRRLKGIVKLQLLTQSHPVSRQTSTTLSYLHSWNRIQAQIRARRLSMVTEGRIKQKKLENQLKLEAKLHDLEVDWCGGSETMEEILARIHQREEAAVKRERTLAYAFSHQWRANSTSTIGPPELGKANWGWSWMERWIAARPWESRVPIQPASTTGKNLSTPTKKAPVSIKTVSPNGKGHMKARKLSFPAAEKHSDPQDRITSAEPCIEKEQAIS